MTKNRKGLKFSVFSIIFFSFSFIIFCGIVYLSKNISDKYIKVQKIISTADKCEKASRIIKDSSTAFSEKANFFVMTQNENYAAEYIHEKYYELPIEKALREISSLPEITDATEMRLKVAFEQSKTIETTELYAMKLTYLAKGGYGMPMQIKAQKIRPEHISSNPEEQQKIAQQIIFDQGYLDAKQRVVSNCSLIIDEIELKIKKHLKKESYTLNLMNIILNSLIVILIILTFLYFLLVSQNILFPLKKFINSIRNKESLNVIGSRELRYLAETYNEVHEYDSLTRIFNRNAFLEICRKSEESCNSVGFMLIDLDDLKLINDSFGHVKGDFVLQATASLLYDVFNNDGVVARTGGDEFSILFSAYQKITPDYLSNKIERINRELADLGDVKGVSISAGLAYSTKGYSKQLYDMADQQLFITKEKGKKGISICEQIL